MNAVSPTIRVRPTDAPPPARSRLAWALAAAAGVLAAAVLLLATRLGIGVTPDSGHYLATAENVLAGRGYVRMGPEIMASWPPLFPTLLAAIGWLGIDILQGIRVVNALLLACIAVIGTHWVHQRTGSLAWSAFTGICLALGPPIVYSGSLALSDLPFVFLQVAALRLLDEWVQRGRPSALVACAACLALACLTRYNGVVLVGTAGLCILMLGRRPLIARLGTAALLGAAAVVPLALWIARNYALTGAPAGPRTPSERGFVPHAVEAGYTVMSWYLPYRILATSEATGFALTAVALAVLTFVAWKYREEPLGRTALVCAGSVALFVAFMVAASARMAMDALTHRMMAPAYVPLVIAMAACGALVARGRGPRRAPLAALAVALGALVIAGVTVSRTSGEVRESAREGPGGVTHSNFNTAEWRSSPTLQWAGQNLRGRLLFASSPAALYLATGANARPMPRKHARRNPGIPFDDLSVIREEIAAAGEAYLILNRRSVPTNVFPVAELSPILAVEPIQSFPDGTVYRLTPGEKPSAARIP